MWAKLTGRTIATIDAAPTQETAFDALVDYARALGADLVSYHHTAPPFARDRENFALLSHGFPDEWVETYRVEAFHRIDPITSFAAYQTRPVLWSQVPKRVRLTSEQQDYMSRLNAWLSPGDGMAIPAFGPSGRHGYIGIGRTTPIEHWSGPKIRTVQAVCEAFHLRVCELRLAGLPQDFELSERQMTILSAMSNGTPDAMICGLVNLRPDALSSAIDQLLQTMHVLDRPSAVLRAAALGLLDDAAP